MLLKLLHHMEGFTCFTDIDCHPCVAYNWYRIYEKEEG